MDDKLKNIDPTNLNSDKKIREAISFLLNTVEDQSSLIERQKELIQELKDEINRLKGEQGRPNIKPNTSSKDYSSQSREKKKSKNRKKGPKRDRMVIDHVEPLEIPISELPADAKLKYYDEVVRQDAQLVRNNVLYRVAVYYSPSLRKTFRASLPKEHMEEFGANLQALLHTLYYGCDVTQGRIKALMDSIGISISTGSIDHILKSQEQWALAEQEAILQAGIDQSPYVQTDSTGNREKGRQKSTHVICAEFFSVFYTLEGRKRFDVLTALQGNPKGGIGLSYNVHTRTLLQVFKVSQADQNKLARLFKHGQPYSKEDFCRLIQQKASSIAAKKNILARIIDSFALGHYFAQEYFPVVDLLLTDDATEYQKIARSVQALCWVHDARPYNKLTPRLDYHCQLLEDFKDQYWTYYDKLLDFKELPSAKQAIQKSQLEAEFDKIFTQTTNFAQLDKLISGTYANKDKLLAVLDHPALPLHNNAAELAARRMVRKRDVSLHTMSPKGTKVRDAFLSIVETAAKLGVNALDYIADRITGQTKMISLADSIKLAYQ
jgi:hypothetical protein